MEAGQTASAGEQSGLKPESALTLLLLIVELIVKDKALRLKNAISRTTAQVKRNNMSLILLGF